MVCPRCITAVEQELQSHKLTIRSVELGKAEVAETIIDLTAIRKGLDALGFELLLTENEVMTGQVRTALLEAIDAPGVLGKPFKLSSYLESRLSAPYSKITRVFSAEQSETIEQYFIKLKIEKAKELISYGEQNVRAIAERLGYTSVQHLYSQFKETAGMGIREFKSDLSRNFLDDV